MLSATRKVEITHRSIACRTCPHVRKLTGIRVATVEVSREGVMLAGLKLGQKLLDALLNLGEFRNERLSVHIVIFHDMIGFASNS